MADAKSNPNAQLLEELEALSESLYKQHTSTTTRRTASLVLPRTSAPPIEDAKDDDGSSNKARRRMSMSPWRSRPKNDDATAKAETKKLDGTSTISSGDSDRKGIWKWKPIRALSHIGMQKLSCLFSVEVVAAQGLPSSMNGLRLSVCVRKKETKDGAVKTMPSRVSQGAADFEETLFIRCHVYHTSNQGTAKQIKFEPRPFWIYLFAVDAKELDFGRSSVDLTELIRESIEKNQQGTRVRQWDTSFGLSGKAKGGELVLKLGFQIMEKDGGVDIYNNQVENSKSSSGKLSSFSSSFARKQSKTSFSMSSPRMTSRNDAWTPSQSGIGEDIQGMDDLNLDDPNPAQDSSSSTQKVDERSKEQVEDFDLPDFEVVDKGVEVQEKEEDGGEEAEEPVQEESTSSEVVKEVVLDHVHLTRLSELDSIAQQIKALESMMGEDDKFTNVEEETEPQRLDADEETVTREFLQMLEDQDNSDYLFNQPEIPPLKLEGHEDASSEDGDSKVYLPDLGKGLGCVIQTRDGGYLASMNPLDIAVARKDAPKLAMQMSRPFVLASHQSLTGFELFQKLAGIGFDELSSKVLSLMPIDEMIGKTAEQAAFEGIANAIIQGRNKEGASSSAARIVSYLKSMGSAMSSGRRERITTGLWNVEEEPLTAEKLLAFAMQKVESMTVEALKIQADMAEELEAPFDISAKKGEGGKDLLASVIPLEEWIRDHSYAKTVAGSDGEPEKVTLVLVVQLRDPLRRYEAVGGPVMVLIHATSADTKGKEEEKRFKVTSMHVGGFKLTSAIKKNAWDSGKQRLTAMQWLVAYGLGKAGNKKGKQSLAKGQQDQLWSISSRIVADMWLKTMRNPDINLGK
ncbi:Protein PLASTID MOVEMENT IMPAIRED 1 [Glycine max]|nr:Protein PLASTID MOVEMENT IMPAIRED 1 [Glycine max]